MTLEGLEDTLKMLRRQGVQRYHDTPGEGFTVEFFPASAPDVKEDKPKPNNDVDMCVCGHALYAHVNNLCVEGCDVEQCDSEAKKK